jgi:hypothetical protein
MDATALTKTEFIHINGCSPWSDTVSVTQLTICDVHTRTPIAEKNVCTSPLALQLLYEGDSKAAVRTRILSRA